MAYWLKGGTVLSLFISAAALFMRTLFCIHIYTSAFSFPAFPFAHSACQVTAVHCSCGMPLVVMVVNAVLEKVEKIYRTVVVYMFVINVWIVPVLVGALSIAFPSVCPSVGFLTRNGKTSEDLRLIIVVMRVITWQADAEISQSLTLQFWQKRVSCQGYTVT